MEIQCPKGHSYTPSSGVHNDQYQKCEEGGYIPKLSTTPDCPVCRRQKLDDLLCAEAEEVMAARFDPQHPSAVDRYLNGEELGA